MGQLKNDLSFRSKSRVIHPAAVTKGSGCRFMRVYFHFPPWKSFFGRLRADLKAKSRKRASSGLMTLLNSITIRANDCNVVTINFEIETMVEKYYCIT